MGLFNRFRKKEAVPVPSEDVKESKFMEQQLAELYNKLAKHIVSMNQ